ncbi:MAG: septum formation initiator family protein [Butyricicoccus sp.]|nr:septum formation initiator family protein [Butyricicoccus sp.]
MAQSPSKLKIRRSNKFALLLLVSIIVMMGVMLRQMNTQLDHARGEQMIYAQRLALLQEQNAKLAEDIANSGNQDLIADIARNDLGMAFTDEKIFRFRR